MKKIIYLALLGTSFLMAAEPKKEELKPVPLYGAAKHVADVDPNTGKLTVVEGIKPEEVYSTLIGIIQNDEKQLADCKKELEKKDKAPVSSKKK